MTTLTTPSPCATCDQVHVHNDKTGWYADNGHGRHPYRAKEIPTMPTEATGYQTTGVATAFFVQCRRCSPWVLVWNERESLADHDRAHGADA